MPTNGSSMILKPSIENGSLSLGMRTISSPRVDVVALDAAAIDRRGQIVDDRVEQRLHALVLERRAAEHRHERNLLRPPCGCSASGCRCPAPARRDRRSSHRRRVSTAASIRVWRYSSAFALRSAGISSSWYFAPRPSSSQTTAFMRRRSMTPLKFDSEPIGSWIQTGRPPTLVLISSTQRKKSAPILSILLTNTMRGTLYLSAWRQTVSVCGSTP